MKKFMIISWVYTSDEHCIKSDLSKDFYKTSRGPKRIKLHGYIRSDSESLSQVVMSNLEVAQYIAIVWTSWVWRDKASMLNIKLAIGDQAFDNFLCFCILVFVVPSEVDYIPDAVCHTRILLKISIDWAKYFLKMIFVVLIIGLKPARIHVRVRHEMYLDLFLIHWVIIFLCLPMV